MRLVGGWSELLERDVVQRLDHQNEKHPEREVIQLKVTIGYDDKPVEKSGSMFRVYGSKLEFLQEDDNYRIIKSPADSTKDSHLTKDTFTGIHYLRRGFFAEKPVRGLDTTLVRGSKIVDFIKSLSYYSTEGLGVLDSPEPKDNLTLTTLAEERKIRRKLEGQKIVNDSEFGRPCKSLYFELAKNSPLQLVKLIQSDYLPATEITYALEATSLIKDMLQTIDLVSPFLNHEKPYVREGAIYGLGGYIEYPEVQALIKSHYERETSPGVREAIEEVLESDEIQ